MIKLGASNMLEHALPYHLTLVLLQQFVVIRAQWAWSQRTDRRPDAVLPILVTKCLHTVYVPILYHLLQNPIVLLIFIFVILLLLYGMQVLGFRSLLLRRGKALALELLEHTLKQEGKLYTVI